MKKSIKLVLPILFILYIGLLAYLLFISQYYNRRIGRIDYNLVPFSTIISYLRTIGRGSPEGWITNLLGNIAAFVPMGFFLPVVFNRMRKFSRAILGAFAASLSAEAIQMILTVGSFDVDDMILNTLGGAMGFAAFILTAKALKAVFPMRNT